MEEKLLQLLRMLADGVTGPRPHQLLDEIEAAGKPAPAQSPSGGTK